MLTVATGCNKDNAGAKKAEDNTVRIEGAFRGEEEARFQEIVKIFNELHPEYTVTYEGSPDFEVQIQVETQANTPPDIAVLPQPGTMKRFADAGYLKPLDASVISSIEANYAPVWKELGSYKGNVYGVFHRVNAKSFVWYNKKEWEKRGYKIPTTWDELRALEEQMVSDGITPWARVGGALFPHKNQNFDDYGNSLEREIAKILVNASVFRFDASDLMPTEVGSGSFWTGMVNYVSGAETAEQCLSVIDETWPR